MCRFKGNGADSRDDLGIDRVPMFTFCLTKPDNGLRKEKFSKRIIYFHTAVIFWIVGKFTSLPLGVAQICNHAFSGYF